MSSTTELSRNDELHYRQLIGAICWKGQYDVERFDSEFATVPLNDGHLAIVQRSLLDGQVVQPNRRISLNSLTELLKDSGARVHQGEFQGHKLHFYLEPHQDIGLERHNTHDITEEDGTRQGLVYALLKAGESSVNIAPNSVHASMYLAGMRNH
jgi:hypothetical protein